MPTKLSRTLAISLIALSFGTSANIAFSWTAPTAQPPAGNVDEPINTGIKEQTKNGDLIVDTSTATNFIGTDWGKFWNLFVPGTTQFGTATTPASMTVFGNVGIGTTDTTGTSKLKVAGIIESTSGGIKFPDGTTQATASGATDLSNLNATNLTSGTVPGARISGAYSGITGVGTVTAGTWNGTALLDSYIGSAATWNTKAPAASPTFTGNVTMPSSGIWNSSGNVGIGTTNPGAKLDVAGSTKLAGPITLTDAGYFLGAPSYGFRFNDNASAYNNFIIYENGNTYTRGNVGIGTTDPAGYNLNVAGVMKVNRLDIMGDPIGAIHVVSGNVWIDGGNLGIGKMIPEAKLDVAGKAKFSDSVIIGSGLYYGGGAKLDVEILAGGTQKVAIYGLNSNGASGGNSIGVFGGSTTGGLDFYGRGGESAANGVWSNASDRNKKENFKSLDNQSVLNKIIELPITEWNYKTAKDTKHIGPVAQDFYSIFGLGDDNISISTIDPAGVSLVGIKALNEKIENQQKEIEELKERLTAIELR